MPNHVVNVISGQALPLIREILAGSRPVDFNRLRPMPDLISKTARGSKPFEVNGETVRFHVWYCDGDESRPLTDIEETRLADLGGDWYEWCCANWGTKWNAYDIEDRGDEIKFETAWSFPQPIFERLCDAVALRTRGGGDFNWRYADEDFGANLGEIDVVDGVPVSNAPTGTPDELAEWAMRLHGYTDADIAAYHEEMSA